MEITDTIQPEEMTDGGGTNPPPGYKPTTPQQRNDWNAFLDNLKSKGNINLSDPKTGENFLNQYRQNNPNFSITPEQLPYIQYEAQQLRTGDSFGSLNADSLKKVRSGMSPNFLNQNNLYQSYYPQFKSGGKDFGTDIEGYATGVGGKPIMATPEVPAANSNNQYADPKAREEWTKKVGIEDWFGDIPRRVNEIPIKGTDTAKNLFIKASKLTGIDPALLYTSSMVEGMSGMFKKKDGSYGPWLVPGVNPDSEYPVSGSASFGNDNFLDRADEFIKKGYLPRDFKSKYIPFVPTDKNVTTNSALYKTTDDAVLAKAARLKADYDEIDEYTKEKGIKLSPSARDFFSLAHYNSGLGKQMIKEYNQNGYLKGDAFLKSRPTQGQDLKETSYKQVYQNVISRLKARDALKQEKQF